MNNEEINNNVQEPTVTPTENPIEPTPEVVTPVEVTPNIETNIESPVTETTAETITETPVETQANETPVETTPTEPVVEAPVEEATAETNNETVETPEAPIGEVNEVITSTNLETPDDPTAKKSKKGLFIGIGIVVAIIIILLVVLYITQYTTAKKRLSTISEGLFDTIKLEQLIKPIKDQQSGSYKINVSGEITSDDDTMIDGSIDLNGSYAIDTTKENTFLSLDFQNIILNRTSLIDAAEVKGQVEIDKDSLYIDANEVYDQVLEYKGNTIQTINKVIINTLKQTTSDETINYNVLMNELKTATNNTLESIETKQSIKSIDSYGLSNVITIELTKESQEKIVKEFYKNIINSNIPSQLAKSNLLSEEKIKDYIQKSADVYEADDDLNATIEIITSMFGKELKAIKYSAKQPSNSCSKEDAITTISKEENGFKIVTIDQYNQNSKTNIEISNDGTTTTYSIKEEIKNIQANKKYNDNGELESCTAGKEDTSTIDMTISFKNSDTEQGITYSYKSEENTSCEDDSKICVPSKYITKLDIKENATIDASYNETPIKKDNTKSIKDFTVEDSLTLIGNITSKYGKIYGIVTDTIDLFTGSEMPYEEITN